MNNAIVHNLLCGYLQEVKSMFIINCLRYVFKEFVLGKKLCLPAEFSRKYTGINYVAVKNNGSNFKYY